jgi:hypothetical protein
LTPMKVNVRKTARRTMLPNNPTKTSSFFI